VKNMEIILLPASKTFALHMKYVIRDLSRERDETEKRVFKLVLVCPTEYQWLYTHTYTKKRGKRRVLSCTFFLLQSVSLLFHIRINDENKRDRPSAHSLTNYCIRIVTNCRVVYVWMDHTCFLQLVTLSDSTQELD